MNIASILATKGDKVFTIRAEQSIREALVALAQHNIGALAAVFALCGLAALVGLVHSPLPSGAVFWPWTAGAPLAVAAPLAGAYGVLSALAPLAAAHARTR